MDDVSEDADLLERMSEFMNDVAEDDDLLDENKENLLLYLDSMFMLVALYLPGNSPNNQIALVGVVISCEWLN